MAEEAEAYERSCAVLREHEAAAVKSEYGALQRVSAADPLLRKALPSALRQLLDHNGRARPRSCPRGGGRGSYRKL